MIIKVIIKVFEKLLKNKKIISERLYYKTVQKGISQVGNVSSVILLGINRLGQIIKYFYINIILVILVYIGIFINFIKEILMGSLVYIQISGKYIIEKLMIVTGPLNEDVLRNLWLIYVLIIMLSIIFIMYKVIKYLITIYKVYKINKENLKNELKIELSNLEKLEKAKELVSFENKLKQAKLELEMHEKKNNNEIIIEKKEEKIEEQEIPTKVRLGKIEYNFEKYLKKK